MNQVGYNPNPKFYNTQDCKNTVKKLKIYYDTYLKRPGLPVKLKD